MRFFQFKKAGAGSVCAVSAFDDNDCRQSMPPGRNLSLGNQPQQVPKPLIVRAVVQTVLPDDIVGIIIVNSCLLSRNNSGGIP
jgi:hypothetical protein